MSDKKENQKKDSSKKDIKSCSWCQKIKVNDIHGPINVKGWALYLCSECSLDLEDISMELKRPETS